jgi:predicted tellurium resistance membrane protein TerC
MLALVADSEFWARWSGIVVIDLLLAGDNAIVIAMAVRLLPKKEQMLGRVWGTVGAVALLWVAWKLLPSPPRPQPADDAERKHIGGTLGEAIRIIVVADVSMSLDNVLAVAGIADGDLLLVISGIALTIPLVVWGSALLSVLMTRLPFLVWIGCGVLGYVAGMLLVEDREIQKWCGDSGDPHLHPIAFGLAALFIGLGWWRSRRARRR